jgi:hypothetical protein
LTLTERSNAQILKLHCISIRIHEFGYGDFKQKRIS